MSMSKFFSTLKDLIILARPEWGFIFSGVVFMLSLFYLFPLSSIVISWLTIYLFTSGHFSLNGLYDKESDAINPRGFSLRNPLAIQSSTNLSSKLVYFWVGLLWSLGFILALFAPNAFTLPKSLSLILVFGISIGGSIMYSVPPIRLKSRPFIDIISTLVIIGVFFPLWVAFLGPEDVISYELLFYGIMLNILLVLGIHLPTILTDLDIDIQSGERTTAVVLGWEKGSFLTAGAIILRVIGFGLLNLHFMNLGILSPSVFPFIIGLIEMVLAVNLIWRKNQQAVSLLWKIIIGTSIIGGVLFGFLYSPY